MAGSVDPIIVKEAVASLLAVTVVYGLCWFTVRSLARRRSLKSTMSPGTSTIERRSPRLLVVLGAGALLCVALQGQLIHELSGQTGLVAYDVRINAFFSTARVQPLLNIFVWITALGAAAAAVPVILCATGLLSVDGRKYLILPLWITVLGSQLTSWSGKYLLGRLRPPFLDVASASSPAFPSGHSTTSVALYGFLAYAVAIAAADLRTRFEVVFWTTAAILLIGFSRIFLSLHYLTDVLSGFLVGAFWLLVGIAFAEYRKRPPAPPAPDSTTRWRDRLDRSTHVG